MENNQEKSKRKNLFYMLIIFLLLGLIGYLAMQINSINKLNHAFTQKNNRLIEERTELNQILESSGVISETDNNNLKLDLQNMLSTYDSLKYDNETIQDSVEKQKLLINDLLLQAEKLQKQKKKDWGSIYKLKKETETLRSIMKGYIHTIDSLNTLNINLQNTLTIKDKELNKVQSENLNIKTHNQELQETVAIGSILQTSNFLAQGIRVKSNGKQTETTRAGRANMLKGCFTLIENKITSSGNKYIYLRIISPDGSVLSLPSAEYIKTNNETQLEISAKREINYQNDNTDVCIYYESDKTLVPGNYLVEIYADLHKIGVTSFALK